MSDRPKVGTHVGLYGQREPRDYEVQVEWLEARLAEAEAIIVDLCAHEGAEGWSQDLNARLARFSATDSASGRENVTP
jgi:hypothetical protein